MNLRTMIANRPNQKRPAKMTPAVALAVQVAVRAERNNRPARKIKRLVAHPATETGIRHQRRGGQVTRHIRDAENNRVSGSTTVSAKPSYGVSLLGDEGMAPVIRAFNDGNMIVQIDGIRCPCFPGAPVYDYASIESDDEFRRLVEPACIIYVVDTESENQGIVYGVAVLEAIKQKVIPNQALSVVVFAVNCSFPNLHLEHICVKTEAVKGLHDWPTDK